MHSIYFNIKYLHKSEVVHFLGIKGLHFPHSGADFFTEHTVLAIKL